MTFLKQDWRQVKKLMKDPSRPREKYTQSLLHMKELAQRINLEVIYGDTDSIMINTNSDVMDNWIKLQTLKPGESRGRQIVPPTGDDIDGVFKSMLLLKKK